MKKTLFALALLAFTGTTAFAHEGDEKEGKKGKKKAVCTTEAKASCSKEMAAAMPNCCMNKGAKTAAVKPAEKAPATVKL
ncbi:hypothetical protein BEN47_01990 [Hymenobacter lapidarius]|uniref:Phosphate starvation-inducible protein PsiF n=1 Tax=Hymenobacter lapidarius TaxID=1908237 RepID=A0A1G1T2N8_9BACT|nr:hypothetical protein [Hymenobacter lapidarius]OGX85128.1 hypothetical protein BEN47_01990 [Hymenobacter lapidarius]